MDQGKDQAVYTLLPHFAILPSWCQWPVCWIGLPLLSCWALQHVVHFANVNVMYMLVKYCQCLSMTVRTTFIWFLCKCIGKFNNVNHINKANNSKLLSLPYYNLMYLTITGIGCNRHL